PDACRRRLVPPRSTRSDSVVRATKSWSRRFSPSRNGKDALMFGPFEKEHAEAWSDDLVDLEDLNRHVSDAVVKAIEHIRDVSGREPGRLRAESLLILGPAGSGKTH